MQLSSRRVLFAWSRADRAPDTSFFRLRALNWQPVLRRPKPVEAAPAGAVPKLIAKLPKCLRPSAKWTPWLLER